MSCCMEISFVIELFLRTKIVISHKGASIFQQDYVIFNFKCYK